MAGVVAKIHIKGISQEALLRSQLTNQMEASDGVLLRAGLVASHPVWPLRKLRLRSQVAKPGGK